MENQGAAGALQLGQEVNDEHVTRCSIFSMVQ